MAINNSNEIVGSCPKGWDEYNTAVMWDSHGQRVTLEYFPLSRKYSYATSINDDGQIVGKNMTNSNDSQIVIWEDSDANPEIIIPEHSGINITINNFGQVAADRINEEFHSFAFLWSNDTFEYSEIGNDHKNSWASDINNLGQIAGSVHDDTLVYEAYMSQDGDVRLLGNIPGRTKSGASAINDQTQVVGTSSYAGTYPHAFLWENNTIYDLNDYVPPRTSVDDWELVQAEEINNNELIIVNGKRFIVGVGTVYEKLLLVPVPFEPTPGDMNFDGDIDGNDLSDFSQAHSLALPQADLNNDGLFNQDDVIIFANNFGR